MKVLKILLKYKYLIFILVVFISLIRSNINIKSAHDIKDTFFKGTIIDYKIKEDYITFTIKTKEKIKCNYYLKNNEKITLNYGDIIYLKGTLKEPTNNTIPNTFNYKKYLNNNNIFYILNIEEIINIKRTNNIFYKLKNIFQTRIDKLDKTGYLNAFILGNKNAIDENTYNNYKINGIIHIFSISGMHISILSTIILTILNKIKKNKYNILIVITFLMFYLVLTNYQASIVRSIVFFTLLQIFKLIKINISTKDTLLYSIAIILLIYPKFIYNIGFLYSSIISYTLIYYSNKFNKNYILNLLLVSFISFLVSLPITVNNNYQINLLSILINLIFVPLVSFVLYPLSLLNFLFPFLSNIFEIFINITEIISNAISNITLFNISIPKLNIITIIIYYLLLYLSLSKNKKYFLLLITLILITKNINKFDSNYYIYFLDVGQGDMTVLKYKDKTIVIDTGPKSYNSTYEITDNHIKFFYSIGITQINFLVITHGDNDHIGNANYLVNNFKVKNVILNNGEINELEKDLIKLLNRKSIKYYQSIKEIKLKNNNLYFINNETYDNENDNSIIMYTKFYNTKLLLTGDAGEFVENNIVKKYNLKIIDILKVGHHGSNTSSSKKFIDNINPKYSIISVGKNNRYGHPKQEVLNNLNNSKIYRTDLDGTIMFKIMKDNLNIKTYSP